MPGKECIDSCPLEFRLHSNALLKWRAALTMSTEPIEYRFVIWCMDIVIFWLIHPLFGDVQTDAPVAGFRYPELIFFQRLHRRE